jgi:hypothetical protein
VNLRNVWWYSVQVCDPRSFESQAVTSEAVIQIRAAHVSYQRTCLSDKIKIYAVIDDAVGSSFPVQLKTGLGGGWSQGKKCITK